MPCECAFQFDNIENSVQTISVTVENERTNNVNIEEELLRALALSILIYVVNPYRLQEPITDAYME